MEYYPQRNKGFAIDYDLAEELDIANEYLEWEEGSNDAPLLEIFEEKFGGYIQSLQGFDYDATYVLFDPQTEEVSPEQWDNLISILEDKDVDVIEGSWAELG